MSLEMMILAPYLTTVITESVVAFIWGIREKKDFFIILLINTVTNLTLNSILLMLRLYLPYESIIACVLFMEVAVFVSEAMMFKRLLTLCRHPFAFSAVMNAASFCCGLLRVYIF